jgi:hypothetical protein
MLHRCKLAVVWTWRVLRVFLTLALIFLCVTVGMAFLEVRKLSIGAEQTLQHVNVVADTLNKQAAAVGSEAHRVLLEAGLTAATARRASAVQEKYWNTEVPRLSARAEHILDHTDGLIVSLRETSESLRQNSQGISDQAVATMDAATPALQQAAEALKQTAGTASAATTFISDPNLKAAVMHLNDGAENLATTTKALAGTAQDIQGEVHTLTHPTLVGKIKAWVLFGLEVFDKFVESRFYLNQ